MTFGNQMRLMNPPLWKDQAQPIRGEKKVIPFPNNHLIFVNRDSYFPF